MPVRHRKILAIGLGSFEFHIVDEFLSPGGLEVDRFPSVAGALELLDTLTLDALLVNFPLEEMPLEDFLRTLRRPGHTSRNTPVVLMTREEFRASAEEFIDNGISRVVALDTDAETLLEAVMGVIFVAPRRMVSFPAQFRLENAEPDGTVPCRVRNSSMSGALLETEQRPAKGSRLYFRFEMPGANRPVVGIGEVVRHTSRQEEIGGVGIRFLSFAGNSKTIYESYLQSRQD
ncbi:MAG: PilZ domain-containing protein [Thermoanaerobaculia bacterium]|nr:PilZ domain-containing protein [Thermoanaerobaculia bacterium]